MATASVLPLPAYFPAANERFSRDVYSQDVSLNSFVTPPPGFPGQLHGPLVWTKESMLAQSGLWVLNLSDGEAEFIETALRSFQSTGLHISKISIDNFPLPYDLAQRLDNVSEECYNGRGFCIIRGLQPKHFQEEEHAVIFAGMSAYICSQRGFQDHEREQVLCRVPNLRWENPSLTYVGHLKNSAPYIAKDKIPSPGFTDGAMAFHTDLGDILSLYVVDQAPKGGRSLLASSWQVYNELARAKPQVLHTLADDWTFDTFRDPVEYPPFTRPLLHQQDGKVIFQCSRRPFTGFGPMVRSPLLPAITPAQMDALDSVHFYAAKNAIALDIKPGDILYINNMSILHGRESYEHAFDDAQEAKKGWRKEGERHLLKFFLRDPKRAWKMPPALQELWDSIYGPNRSDGSREETWVLKTKPGMFNKWQVNG